MNFLNRNLVILSITALPLSCVDADNLEFSGTLLAPPGCAVSDKGGRINVRFAQNIAVNRIDGERYRQTIPYQIDCPDASNTKITWHTRLTLKGTDAPFDTTALKTSVDDLGIKVLLGGTALIPNEPREIDVGPSTPPVLEAVPVKRAGAALPSTEFTASALLMAELY
ncbi:pilus assembly protein [Pseudomonas sichuanensis]|uniref:fimbrial protein n=1 Tax=Pseudomonas sichuanensis TaxID=2213015 RepID=UPI00244A31A9|nr:pilus assembly protein [Pseudomonas sichuanensis]MDH0731316.1 pilus assembly protein [Pseudomonas sichuanensis]MDH1583507.1 pilus assembly protein [Pseudomonas sichuanensis]MDH1592755.1 pilus assembly protein [Pseudomonas sichuanensis]MDH1598650.1 pilus assembly protein [Pseudomonas sichuanensis]